ncbi:unnamed protein product [Ectocarpus sp. CCAP 1310/34]|nr:unnamed protein product [Ectocarpus sp. CCAP 1310/34]
MGEKACEWKQLHTYFVTVPRKARAYIPLPFGKRWLVCGLVLLGLLSQHTLLVREQSTQGTSTVTNGVSRTISVTDAPSGPGITTYDERKKVTVSPASSRTNLEFASNFDHVFPSSSLHTTFKRHPAFGAVYAVDDPARGLLFDRAAHTKVAVASSTSLKFVLSPPPKGLVSTIMMAYNHHADLVLRPDDMWLTILAHFCLYVNKNAESLRDRIVNHEGKKVLRVEGGGNLFSAETPVLIREMLGKIRQNVKMPELADWFKPGFTTTANTDEVAAAATAITSLQAYFSYEIHLECGLPSVTLMGTVQDWKLLRAKVERLLDFEVKDNPEEDVMEVWVGYLREVCDGFVESAEHPDSTETLQVWDKVVPHIGGGSGVSYITGWLPAFACFNKDGKFMGRNTNKARIGLNRGGNAVRDESGECKYPLIDTGEICHNAVSCPVKINDNGVEYDGTLFVGQVALEARNGGEGGYPRPRNGWCLAVPAKEDGGHLCPLPMVKRDCIICRIYLFETLEA